MARWRNDSRETLHTNAAGDTVVPENSPEARYVLVGPGGEIEEAEAERLGLTKKSGKGDAKAQPAPAETKAERPSENKARTMGRLGERAGR